MSNDMTLLGAMDEEGALSLAQLLGMDESGDAEEFEFQKIRAEGGARDAMLWIGRMYLAGEIIPQDVSEGLYWLMENNSEKALEDIGSFYEEQGDYEQAEEWYLKAAEREAPYSYLAYNSLGTLFLRTDNMNLEKAAMWTLKSLQVLYEIPKEAQAIEGYLEGVEQFVFGCAKLIGFCYKRSNPVEAAKWLKIALIYDEEDEVALDSLAEVYESLLLEENVPEELMAEAMEYKKNTGQWEE